MFDEFKFDEKTETIEMLRAIKYNAHSISVDGGEPDVLISADMSLDSFLWVINKAIALINDEGVDE